MGQGSVTAQDSSMARPGHVPPTSSAPFSLPFPSSRHQPFPPCRPGQQSGWRGEITKLWFKTDFNTLCDLQEAP